MSTQKRKPLNTAALAAAAVEQPDPVQVATAANRRAAPSPAATAGKGSRTGKVQIQGYFPEETRRRLKMLAAQHDRTLEDLLSEAIADLFKKHST
jgi:hypothetical protein